MICSVFEVNFEHSTYVLTFCYHFFRNFVSWTRISIRFYLANANVNANAISLSFDCSFPFIKTFNACILNVS